MLLIVGASVQTFWLFFKAWPNTSSVSWAKSWRKLSAVILWNSAVMWRLGANNLHHHHKYILTMFVCPVPSQPVTALDWKVKSWKKNLWHPKTTRRNIWLKNHRQQTLKIFKKNLNCIYKFVKHLDYHTEHKL